MDMDAELALLLQEQEQFLKSGKASSVKLHTKPKQPEQPEPSPALPPAPTVVRGSVVERSAPKTRPMPKIVGTAQGFPSTGAKKQSLFGRRRQQTTQNTVLPSAAAIPQDIAADNNAAIANMSVEEIKKAQEELQASLSPEILAMFRNRANAKVNKPTKAAPKLQESILEQKNQQNLDQNKLSLGLKHDKSRKDEAKKESTTNAGQSISNDEELAMAITALPQEEKDKHEWMQPIESKATTKSSSLRVDFHGQLISNTQELPPAHSGLYHHGDEPDLPGYTIEELLLLARSTVSSQRVVACNVLAKVLRNPPKELPFEIGKIVLILRQTLEDTNHSVLTAGIDAMHAALVAFDVEKIQPYSVAIYPVDRLGKPHSIRYVESNAPSEEEKEEPESVPLSVKEIAQIDPIQALLKTHLPFRIRYLLELASLQATISHIQLLDMCIALAMHSRRVAIELMEIKGFSSVLMELLSHEGIDDLLATLPMRLRVVLLIRRLCQADAKIAQICLQHQLLTATKVVLGVRHPGLLPLQLATIRLWTVCLSYGVDLHSFAYLYPLLCGYPATGLTGTPSIVPWPVEMQLEILYALTVLTSNGVESAQYYRLLPYFVHQAQTMLQSIPHEQLGYCIGFLAKVWPIVQHNTSILDTEPYVLATPVLISLYTQAINSNKNIQLIPKLLQYFTSLASAPLDRLQVSLCDMAKEMTCVYFQQLDRENGVPSIDFYTQNMAEPLPAEESRVIFHRGLEWMQDLLPGEEKDADIVLNVIFMAKYPAVLALLRALLGRSTSHNPKESCHRIQPELPPSTLPWPAYWLFSPFSRIAASDLNTSQWQSLLTQACTLLLELETSSPEVLKTTPIAQKLLHLSHIYLLETDSWVEPVVRNTLQSLVDYYINRIDLANLSWYSALLTVLQCYKECEAGKEVELAQSFVDSLVQVFCGVSYGDSGLSGVLVLCMHPTIPLDMRLWLWKELDTNGGLSLLVIPPSLQQGFLYDSIDYKLVEAYAKSLATLSISATRGADAYKLAVHHIATYCFSSKSVEMTNRQQTMFLQILQSKSEKLVQDLLKVSTSFNIKAKLQCNVGSNTTWHNMFGLFYHWSKHPNPTSTELTAAIDADFKIMAYTVSIVRTYYSQHYGIQVAPVAAKYNIQLYLGVYMTTESWGQVEIAAAVQAVKDYPNTILALLFGNENLYNPRLNFGTNSADDILSIATNTRRQILRDSGRWVPIGTSQRVTEWVESSIDSQTYKLANGVCSSGTSEFCSNWYYYPLDILGVNIYPFFDPNYNSNQPFALLNILWCKMVEKFGSTKIRPTESGFPSAGSAPYMAPNNWPSVDGEANYYNAMTQWRPADGGGPLFWFTAFDLPDSALAHSDYERHFGLFNIDRSWKSSKFPAWNNRASVGIQHILYTISENVLSEWNQGLYADI
ncbi:hypothetical protein THRCLA_07553 [Thraustotheca clavata]|uniref:RNA polymerase II-associated protein 1 n=1 Tax=Thraustotheca clavata TaxID=74557 RepID=A0A1V9ZCU2_9STRA|nr:hypothetical protein THRCLA_07553 [Thraustotheca clavata]